MAATANGLCRCRGYGISSGGSFDLRPTRNPRAGPRDQRRLSIRKAFTNRRSTTPCGARATADATAQFDQVGQQTGPRGQPFPQPGSKALEEVSDPKPSRQDQRADCSSNRTGDAENGWPVGLINHCRGRSTARCCVPVNIPLRCLPVHIPIGPPGRPGVWAIRVFPAPTGRQPAQRASPSPSQGRRPWR